MSKKSKKPKKIKKKAKELYCMDCGVLIDPELASFIEASKKTLNMPNMLVFCNDCQFTFKNRLRRIWSGIKHLFS